MSENTPHVQHLLSEYFDALLPEQEHHDVAAHIRDCAECEKRFQELVRLRKMLHELPALTPPAGFYSDVVKKIKGEESISEVLTTAVPFKVVIMACLVMIVVWAAMTGLDKFKFWNKREMPPPKTHDMHPPMPLVDQVQRRDAQLTPATTDLIAPLPPATTEAVKVIETPVAAKEETKKPSKATKTHSSKKAEKSSKSSKSRAQHKDAETQVSKGPSGAQSRQDLLKTPQPTGEKAKLVELEARYEASLPSEFVEWKGMDSAVKKFRKYVIQSPGEMSDVWARHAPNTPVPAVDFKQYQVVGITTGLTHAAGTGFEIIGTRDTVDSTIVYYRERKDMFRVQPSVSGHRPYHFKVIPNSNLPVKFQQI